MGFNSGFKGFKSIFLGVTEKESEH